MSLDGNETDPTWGAADASSGEGSHEVPSERRATDPGLGENAASPAGAPGYGQASYERASYGESPYGQASGYGAEAAYGQYGSYQQGPGNRYGYVGQQYLDRANRSQPTNVYSNDTSGYPNSTSGYPDNTSAYQPYTSGYAPYSPYPNPYVQGPRVAAREPKRIGRGAAAFIAVIALILGALLGAGISAADSRAHISALQDQLNTLRQNHGGSEGQPGAPSDPYMPQPQDGQAPESDHGGTGPIKKGTRVQSAPGVVLINTSLLAGVGAGTGMVISSDGLVLTNYHVVQGSSDVKVTVNDTNRSYTGKVLGHDEEHDVALVQLEGASGLKTVTISSTPARRNDPITAVGNAAGQGYLSKLDGTVTATHRDIMIGDEGGGRPTKLRDLIVTDADVVPGYSGGPMFNANNEVVGMNSAASVGDTTQDVNGFAIPIDEAMDIVNKIKSGEGGGSIVIGRNAALGITVGESKIGEGVGVLAIDPSSNASQAGLSRGDVITEINGDSVDAPSDLARTVREMHVGDTVTLTVRTQGKGSPHEITVKLVESTVN